MQITMDMAIIVIHIVMGIIVMDMAVDTVDIVIRIIKLLLGKQLTRNSNIIKNRSKNSIRIRARYNIIQKYNSTNKKVKIKIVNNLRISIIISIVIQTVIVMVIVMVRITKDSSNMPIITIIIMVNIVNKILRNKILLKFRLTLMISHRYDHNCDLLLLYLSNFSFTYLFINY